MAQVKDFEKLTLEKVDGRRKISIDGEPLDLSEIVSMQINIGEDSHIIIETRSRKWLKW